MPFRAIRWPTCATTAICCAIPFPLNPKHPCLISVLIAGDTVHENRENATSSCLPIDSLGCHESACQHLDSIQKQHHHFLPKRSTMNNSREYRHQLTWVRTSVSSGAEPSKLAFTGAGDRRQGAAGQRGSSPAIGTCHDMFILSSFHWGQEGHDLVEMDASLTLFFGISVDESGFECDLATFKLTRHS
uniref:Secreted protein n=1 Tax=Panagrellus redivivus TaxID=6233 RepID=A0A7E4VZN1_PANRE